MSLIKKKPSSKIVESDEGSKDLSVALGMQRRKKMAKGGMIKVDHGQELNEKKDENGILRSFPPESDKTQPEKWRDEESPLSKMASGGRVESKEHMSIADAIIARKKEKMMAEGGEVELDEEDPAPELDQHAYPFGEELEDEHQPLDSNEHDVEFESDMHDMVSQIMNKMRAKRGL